VLAVNHWLAPEPYLHVCGPRGVWVPRHGAAGLARAAEWLRQRACEAHFRSAGLRGPLRAVAIVFIAAAEEVAWRGGVQQVLSERLGSLRGWVAASVLFGLAHLGTGNVAVGLLALAGGFLWGAIFLWRGRLLPAVLSHAVFSFALFYQNSPSSSATRPSAEPRRGCDGALSLRRHRVMHPRRCPRASSTPKTSANEPPPTAGASTPPKTSPPSPR
jgi:hypothetical protein